MKYLTVDACYNGTGIRDSLNGGYVDPKDLPLSIEVIGKLNAWIEKYKEEHFEGYQNEFIVDDLDDEGRELSLLIKKELIDVKIEYYSDALLTKEMIL